MADTDIDICSRALVLLGEAPITSFNQNTTASRTAKLLYEATVTDMLGGRRWHFAQTTAQMSRLAAEPVSDWDAEYTRPSGALVVHRVTIDDVPIEFELGENTIRCNADETNEVYCTYTVRTLEAYWPPYFRGAVEKELAARFAFPVTAQEALAAKAQTLADRALRQARLLDSQSQTAPTVRQSRFKSAR